MEARTENEEIALGGIAGLEARLMEVSSRCKTQLDKSQHALRRQQLRFRERLHTEHLKTESLLAELRAAKVRAWAKN